MKEERNLIRQRIHSVWIIIFLTLSIPFSVEGQSDSGLIFGSVRDEREAAIENAKIRLTNADTGLIRTTQTDSDGNYVLGVLQPGNYELRAEATGFSPVLLRRIVVNIGLQIRHDLILPVKGAAEDVEVSEVAPLIDLNSADPAVVFNQKSLNELPIASRQYLNLALLAPGTSVDSTRSFFSTVNVGGSVTFNSTLNIVDGVSNNWIEDGEPRQDFTIDSIKEFKISNSYFNAEFGFSTAGMVQTITKSGTNKINGSAFWYARHKALNTRGPFESFKPDFRRNQFGGSLGGPILKNKAHFFGSYERTAQTEFYTVRTGLPQFYSSIEGTFEKPFVRSIYLARLDFQLDENRLLFARYSQEDEHSECSGCGGTIASTGGFDQDTPRRSFVLGFTWASRGNYINEFRFQGAGGGYYISPHGSGIWKRLGDFSSARTGRLRRTFVFPSLTFGNSQDDLGPEQRWQITDTFTILRGTSTFKIGGDYNFLPYTQERTGNTLGTYTFSQDQYFNPNDPASIQNLSGAILFSAVIPPIRTKKTTQYVAGFVQYDRKIGSNINLNSGLRYERFYGGANEDLKVTFPVAIPFINVKDRGNRTNIAPRFGLAWSLFGNHLVLRSGFGIYYGHIRVGVNLGELRNYKQFSISISNPSYPDPYNGQDPFQFITTGPANINTLSNDFRQPYSYVVNTGFSWQVSNQVAVHVDANFNRTYADRKIIDINPRNASGIRPLPQFGRVDQSESSSRLDYNALYLKVERRFAKRYELLGTYTYTRSNDNNPLTRYISPFDKTLDWGPSNGERRHAIVFSGSFLLPYDFKLGGIYTFRSQLPWNALAGLDLNGDGFNTDLVPGTTRNSGSRNLSIGTVNAWRQQRGMQPINESQIDSSAISTLDLLVSKSVGLTQKIKLTLLGQAFNIFNRTNLQSPFGGGRVTNSLSTSFGRILTARPSRQIEVAVRLDW